MSLPNDPSEHRRFTLAKRPVGAPTRADFTFETASAVPLSDGEIRVLNRYISLDPAMRGWMTALPSYIPPVELGAVMRAFGVGEIVESRHPHFTIGQNVTGMIGVQSQIVTDGRGFNQIANTKIPLSAYVGPLGIPGLSAYFGLLEVGQPKPGQTVLVSGAAGAVGSMVGQIAKIRGCRVVGIAGGPEKCRHLSEDLGFDGTIDYKSAHMKRAIRETCPDGVDIYFDNVGGEILNAALGWLSVGARVVLCGAISQYNATTLPAGPSNYLALLVRRARMEGFIVLDYFDRANEAIEEIERWIADGQITYRETIVHGLETFPDTFLRLFTGEKLGKLVLGV
jgi:NADPH-dependent curcumin reductase CurA